MANSELASVMTAQDWYESGYADYERGRADRTSLIPMTRSWRSLKNWERGWYAAEADQVAQE